MTMETTVLRELKESRVEPAIKESLETKVTQENKVTQEQLGVKVLKDHEGLLEPRVIRV